MSRKQLVTVRALFVAILVLGLAAVLLAIAVPSAIGARTLSRTRMTESSMQGAANALEAYRVDYGWYPPPVPSGDGWTRLPQVISDAREHWHSEPERLPFIPDGKSLGYALMDETSEQWAPLLEGLEPRPAFVLLSPGPKKETGAFQLECNMVYDPTNGTFSEGYLYHFDGKGEVPALPPAITFTYDPSNGTSSR